MQHLSRLLPLIPLALTACTPNVAGLQQHAMTLEGRTRTYELRLPEDTEPSAPAPLVVALHRWMADGNDMAFRSGFNAVADREGFMVVYPDAPGGGWNTFVGSFDDEVDMVLAVIDDVASRYAVDRARIYVTGASNGGFMTYAMVCAAPDTFAAAAPVMGLMQAQLAERSPAPPVPILIMHGTRDGIVGYDATWLGRKMLSVDEAVAYWVERNGCAPQPEVEQLEDRDPDDKTRVTMERYDGGAAPVVLYRIEGGGHAWPGGTKPGGAVFTGRMSQDIVASEEIWRFFAEHARPASGALASAGLREDMGRP